jgi:hypothetical protein
MANTESIREIAHSRAPLSTWLGVVLLFVLFGAIVLAIMGPLPRGSDFEETRAKKRLENLKTLREEAEKTLTTYGWVDKNKGVAHIPITRAMEVTVADLAKQRPAPAGPIAAPEAQPTAAAGARPPATSPVPTGPAAPAASPPAQAPASRSPAAQSSPSGTASPGPAKSP